jgi:NADH-quinone oxidoreductase subunit L
MRAISLLFSLPRFIYGAPGSNFLVMFVGWEGVGLCSYLLIGFWYQKQSASDAGKKAFIVNRVGDFGFVLGVLLVFVRFGTIDFQEIARALSTLAPETSFGTLSLITLLLFVGATGKSAQIPLFVWLPDAMEGPTPVSALIHAATMVTAGVYMIGRNAVLFGHAPQTLTIVAIVGVATALMAGTDGLVQNDIARARIRRCRSSAAHVSGHGGGRLCTAGIFPPLHPRVFQGVAVPGIGRGHPCARRRAGFATAGRPQEGLPVTCWTFLVGAVAVPACPASPGSSARTTHFVPHLCGRTPCCGLSGCSHRS